jgi:hypothetical protein
MDVYIRFGIRAGEVLLVNADGTPSAPAVVTTGLVSTVLAPLYAGAGMGAGAGAGAGAEMGAGAGAGADAGAAIGAGFNNAAAFRSGSFIDVYPA